MLRLIIAILFIVPGLACGATSLEKGVSAAAAEERPLVVMATASWCGPCKTFKKYVLPNARVKRALRGVRFLILDSKRDRRSIARLGVRAYPTFLVINRQGKVVASLRGSAPIEKFLSFLRWGAPNWFSKDELAAALRTKPTTELRLLAARWHAINDSVPRAIEFYLEALKSLSPADEARRANMEWELGLMQSVGQPAAVLASKALSFVQRHPSAEGALVALRFFLLAKTLPVDQRSAVAAEIVEMYKLQAQELNAIAYVLLAAELPEVALVAAQYQVALTPEHANAFDTLAEVHHYRKDRSAALVASDVAMAKAPADSRKVFAKNRARFAKAGFEPSADVIGHIRKYGELLARYRITE